MDEDKKLIGKWMFDQFYYSGVVVVIVIVV